MKPTIHILARVRKPELLEAALLVFRTLRTGFPTCPVHVWGNHLRHEYERAIEGAAHGVGAFFNNIAHTSHDEWIESLILESFHPFWVVDTDVVFWGSMETPNAERRTPNAEFAGRFEPAFEEPYTGCVHVERLHTAVMYINPALTRAAMRAFMAQTPEDLRASARFPLIREYFMPVRGAKTVLYDTMAGIYQAGYGTAFSEDENDCFDHLHCGSYVDLVPPLQAEHGAQGTARPTLVDQHKAILANPELLRGARHAQAKLYERLKPKTGMLATARSIKRKEATCRTHQE